MMGEFPNTPSVSTLYLVAIHYQITFRHVLIAANVVSELVSHNAHECHEPNFQVCNFLYLPALPLHLDFWHRKMMLNSSTENTITSWKSEPLMYYPRTLAERCRLLSTVCLYNDGNKNQARRRYIGPEVDGPWCSINSWRPRDAYKSHQIRPSLLQIMACHVFGARPLSEPMLDYCQSVPWKHISLKSESNYSNFLLRKSIYSILLSKGHNHIQVYLRYSALGIFHPQY